MAKLAVLIDADNASHKSIHLVLQEIAKYGTPIIKRMYGIGAEISTKTAKWSIACMRGVRCRLPMPLHPFSSLLTRVAKMPPI